MQLQQQIAVRDHLQAVAILTQKLRSPDRERAWQHLNVIAELMQLHTLLEVAKPLV
jgi:hypothetical protein